MGRTHIQSLKTEEVLNKLYHVNDLYASSGDISGCNVIHKFGHNLDVATIYETLWSYGSIYSYLDTATVLKVSSSSTDDTSSGIGARTIKIQGLDSNYLEIEETITLNGQTPVNTQNSFLRVYRAQVITVGSSNQNNGDIYMGTGTVTLGIPANVYAEIPQNYNQTMMAVYTIPANKTGYMTMFYASPDDSKGFQTQLITGNGNDVHRVRNELHAYQVQAAFEYRPYLKIPEKTDIEMRAKIDNGIAKFGGGFSIILLDND